MFIEFIVISENQNPTILFSLPPPHLSTLLFHFQTFIYTRGICFSFLEDSTVGRRVWFQSCFRCSAAKSCLTLCSSIDCSTQSFTISRSLLKFMSMESVMPSSHLIVCGPCFLLPSIFPSIRVFSNESALHIRQPKYWSFSFSISLSNEYSGLILFGLTGLISLKSKGLSRVFSNTTV